MERGTLQTLALFLQTAAAGASFAGPTPAGPFAFLNAHPLPADAPFLPDAFVCEQGFRPAFLDLQAAGYQVAPRLAAGTYAGALVLAGRNRRANEAMIARAYESANDGGAVIVCGANDDGIRSLRKWASAVCPVGESVSKHHAVAFLMRKQPGSSFAQAVDPESANISPAMFSAGAADTGSRLLARHFDARIKGAVADFGTGSGYLSGELLKKCPHVGRLDLIEADYLSLERARSALSGNPHPAERRFLWLDLAREQPSPAKSCDWVIMNPPFHSGRASVPGLGRQFIEAAGDALKPGGRLLLVANRNLPYEQTLASRFRRVLPLEEGAGYKIVEAVK